MERRLGANAPQRVEAPGAAAKDADLRVAMESLSEEGLMLETLDLTHKLDRESYVREVTRRQIQLRELGYQVYLQKRPVVILFEGWDASGKGGAIKRITEKLDPRGYVVYPIARRRARTRRGITSTASGAGCRSAARSPSSTAPGTGGCWWSAWRASAPRKRGSAPIKEINSFERQLKDFGAVIAKFWIQISREEQLRRFEERKAIGYKAWKLTERRLAQPGEVVHL